MSYKDIYIDFITPEENGRKIGVFRTICSIFGAFVVAYLGMALFAFALPITINESIIISLFFNTLAWACIALWIALSSSKLIAFLRVLIPSFIFSISLYLIY